MLNDYETMYILRSDSSEEQVNQALDKYRNFLSERGAEEIEVQVRGKRRLAYPIQKQSEGIYVQMNYKADGNHIAPLERSMRLSEEVIRYLTIKMKQPKSSGESQETAETTAEVEAE